MLDQVLKWVAAGDAALVTMGPVVAIALAMLGGAGITQALKFWLVQYIENQDAERQAIQMLATLVTGALLVWFADLHPALVVIVAFAQPYAYKLVARLIRHRWPWLEATKAAGSLRPSDEARRALLDRRDLS